METVSHMPVTQSLLVNLFPLIYMGAIIFFIVLGIRYFIRLGQDVHAIRKLLEDKQ